ncbi:molybdate-anion transporter [Protopterus annectens]|uniref:molybdate-anion transporter n=1 Tax=Protopterus annectens TaxID=7888 RepID=UPI001CFB6053|nr:molybdate-anion transporter [Protopterus annectens]XP_043939825.1 molybdate-anion transporter [Protopterus annectens]XP_043939826.1 molybdate-anion transporter [Protopterus annectens]
MLITTYIAFFGLLALCLGLEFSACRTKTKSSSCSNSVFLSFQLEYYQVYFLALTADWLQGPYLYKLYQHYQFLESQIAIIFVCGFASSVFFGLISTSLADWVGRKKSCILFSLTYSICCLTKLSQDYFVLIVGRILGGLSTSLLFTAFEAWYIHEHTQRHDFPTEWITLTASQASFWNHIIAIGAGVIANIFAEWFGLGPVAPFMVSIPFLMLTGVFIMRSWNENYGNPRIRFAKMCTDGLKCLISDRRVLLLGTIQALFESVVYIFIFLWTPVLDPYGPPLGIVFSSFMAASMIGSSLYRIATSKKYHLQPMHILSLSVLMVFFSLFMLTFSTNPGQENPSESFLAFLLIELACGLYFPAMGFLRRKVIPETSQVGVMNWFRVPLNLLACLGLLILHDSDKTGTRNMFAICAALMVMALLAVVSLFTVVRNNTELKVTVPEEQTEASDVDSH